MFSNLPTMLQQQDFDASHRDMVEAARGGVTVDLNAPVLTVVIQRHVNIEYRMPVIDRDMSFGDRKKWFEEARRRLTCSPESPIPPPSSRD